MVTGDLEALLADRFLTYARLIANVRLRSKADITATNATVC